MLFLFLLTSGCVKDSYTYKQIDETVASLIDTEITCPGVPEDTCAIDSEFHQLAVSAFNESTPEKRMHYISLLNIGQDALLARLHLIRSAKKSIDIQTFIWANDEVGRLIFFELLKAARRGVKVRLIADQLLVQSEPGFIARLATAHENLEMSFYNPTFNLAKSKPLTIIVGGLFSFRKINQRMHNKVFIVDARIGIVGGRNIENKYYDYDQSYNFKDRDAIVIGPAVGKMRESFERYWNNKVVVRTIYLTDVGSEIKKLDDTREPGFFDKPDFFLFSDIDRQADTYSICSIRPACTPFKVSSVEFIADLPGKPTDEEAKSYGDSTSAMRNVSKSAENSLTIQTPYLVLSRHGYKSLKKMRSKYPDLKLTISTNSLASTDALMVYAMSYKHKRNFIKKLDANLFEFVPLPGDAERYIPRYEKLITEGSSDRLHDPSDDDGLMPVAVDDRPRFGIHAKSLVIDSKIAVIGSHNLTPRSVNLNTESALIIRDERVARALEANILRDTEPQNSWVIARQEKVPLLSHVSDFIGSVSQMLPFFDVWPFRYASSYQLREGMAPLSPYHPEFYKHYDNVGQFPQVNMPTKTIKTRLMKAFGGFTTPLM